MTAIGAVPGVSKGDTSAGSESVEAPSMELKGVFGGLVFSNSFTIA